MTTPIRLLGLSGSLRRQSNSTTILTTLRDAVAPEIEITIGDIGSVPHYNADQEGDNAPESVRALKALVAANAGLLVVSPEYNYGMPGVLKNALDWASRPAFKSVLAGKPAGVITSSRAFTGGVRAQLQIKQTLYGCLARTLPWPEVLIGLAHEKIKDGRLVEETSLKFALDLVRALADDIRAHPPAA